MATQIIASDAEKSFPHSGDELVQDFTERDLRDDVEGTISRMAWHALKAASLVDLMTEHERAAMRLALDTFDEPIPVTLVH